MSVNTMDFNQVSTVLNDIYEQASGQKSLAPTTPAEWVSVAQKTLAYGYDPVLNAITQVIGRTIFSNRPYSRRFAGLQVDEQIWGAITRKINIADKPFEDDARFDLVDGQAIDHYVVNKPNILQTNFYGARTVLAALFIWVGFIVRNQGLILYRKSWFPVLGFSLVTLGAFFWQASCRSHPSLPHWCSRAF